MHKYGITGLALVLTFVLAACDKSKPSATTTRPSAGSGPATCSREPIDVSTNLTIAVVPKGTTHEFWKAIHAGALKAQMELKGVQIEWKGPTKEDDREQQINVLENFINQGVHGIAVAPLDDTALVRPVQDAVKAGISVVIVDSGLNAEACTDYASFVATDNYLGGRKGGARLGELLDGKGKVLMMRYQVGSASTMQREQGFLDELKEKYPGIEIVSSDQHGGATTESAYAKAENLLNRFTELKGIFCPNESTTFGMLRALQESGREGDIVFVGFDSSAKLIQALRDDQIHGLVLQDPLNMGYLSVKTLVAFLRGETVETRIDTGCVVATPENMDDPRIAELLAPPIDKYLP